MSTFFRVPSSHLISSQFFHLSMYIYLLYFLSSPLSLFVYRPYLCHSLSPITSPSHSFFSLFLSLAWSLPHLLPFTTFFPLILHDSPLSYRPTHLSHFTKQSGNCTSSSLSSLPLALLLLLLPQPLSFFLLACAPYSLTFALSTGFRGQPGQSAEAAKGKHTGNRQWGRTAEGGGGRSRTPSVAARLGGAAAKAEQGRC